MAEVAATSLYERLGGYEALCAATDDLLGAWVTGRFEAARTGASLR
jgi:hypothetical protein